jgi:hypothetical protein
MSTSFSLSNSRQMYTGPVQAQTEILPQFLRHYPLVPDLHSNTIVDTSVRIELAELWRHPKAFRVLWGLHGMESKLP